MLNLPTFEISHRPWSLKALHIIKILCLSLCISFFCHFSRVSFANEDALSVKTGNGLYLALSSDGQLMGLEVSGHKMPVVQGPLLMIRDMSLAGRVSSPNLLFNPGFEHESKGWNPLMIKDTAVFVDNTIKRSGQLSLRFHGLNSEEMGAGAVYSRPVSVTPGKLYRISGYFLSSRGYLQGVSGTPTFYQDRMWRESLKANGLYVRWFDKNGKDIYESPVLVAPVHWNARNWRRVSGEVHAPPNASKMEILVVARLQDEFMWVDDICVVESPEKDEPVFGSVTKKNGSLVQTGATEDGLTLKATYTPMDDHVRIHIEVKDSSGKERALELSWGLPLLITGNESGDSDAWRWWDDAHHSRLIQNVPVAPFPEYPFPSCLSWKYEHVVSGVWDGWLPVSLYPYGVIENGKEGLALAASLESPRLVKISYDQTNSRYEVRAYLGISPRAERLKNSSDIVLELYLTDPKWGFRSAVALYAKRHRGWFTSKRDASTFSGYERGYYNSKEGAMHVLELDEENFFAAEYTVADALVDMGPSSTPLPGYDDLLRAVLELPDAQSKAIVSSVAYGGNGDWQLKSVGDFKWAAGKWLANWFTSVDPDIDGGWGQYLWNENIEPSIYATEALGAVLDGILMDNFMSVPGIDLRDEHLALADTPLSYDIATYRPGIHNMANIHEYFSWLREKLLQRDRDDMAIVINFWGLATPNALAPFIDVFGGEGQSKTDTGFNWTTRILDYRRAISYQRTMAWSNEESHLSLEDVRAYISRALFYGIFPGRKKEAVDWEAGSDEILKNAQGLFQKYAPSAWEPVTYASSESDNVWVERFGSLSDSNEEKGLFFTIYNNGHESLEASIRINISPLGIKAPESATITDVSTGENIGFTLSEKDMVLTLELGPMETRIIQVKDGTSPGLSEIDSVFEVLVNADPSEGPGPLSPLWRPGIVWEGGGGGGTSVNPRLVDYWEGLGGFDRIGLVRIVPELDSLSKGAYSLSSFSSLVKDVRDHGGRLLVKILTTPFRYTRFTDNSSPSKYCPPNDPSDYRYSNRYNKYGVKPSEEEAYKALIKDFIRYFSGKEGYVVNPELFGDNDKHPVLSMPQVLYELWDEPNYDMKWCDTEENFFRLYQLIVEAADEVRREDLLPFKIGGPGWRKETLRNDGLGTGFGASGCPEADEPSCGAVRRFYDFLASKGFLENGHISWWSYSYSPTEVSRGETNRHLQNIHKILNDPRYQGHYSDTLVVLGEWGPPFANHIVDLVPSRRWVETGEYGIFFGKNINDDNEVGASLVPQYIFDMTNSDPAPSLQSYFQIGEWPTEDHLPLFKGNAGIITAQATGLLKAVSNVFLMLNRLEPQELKTRYGKNPVFNLIATSSLDAGKIVVLGWYHPSIKPYEKNGWVQYDELMEGLEQSGIKPVSLSLDFENLAPMTTYHVTIYRVDKTHSNSFSYRHKILERLMDDCGENVELWKRSCVYNSIGLINSWTLESTGKEASVGLESTKSVLTADENGKGKITLSQNPYSVFLIVLERDGI